MDVEIRQINKRTVLGAALRTKADGSNSREIPEFWLRFLEEDTASKIPGKIDPEVCFGVCTEMDPETGEFSYVIGYEVSEGTEAPPGFSIHIIPHATYAVFRAEGNPDGGEFTRDIQSTNNYAFGEWLPASSEWDRAEGPDIEVYDERLWSDGNTTCEICFPVKKK